MYTDESLMHKIHEMENRLDELEKAQNEGLECHQIVWYVENGSDNWGRITKAENSRYQIDGGRWFRRDQVYLTRDALIQAQLKYWRDRIWQL